MTSLAPHWSLMALLLSLLRTRIILDPDSKTQALSTFISSLPPRQQPPPLLPDGSLFLNPLRHPPLRPTAEDHAQALRLKAYGDHTLFVKVPLITSSAWICPVLLLSYIPSLSPSQVFKMLSEAPGTLIPKTQPATSWTSNTPSGYQGLLNGDELCGAEFFALASSLFPLSSGEPRSCPPAMAAQERSLITSVRVLITQCSRRRSQMEAAPCSWQGMKSSHTTGYWRHSERFRFKQSNRSYTP